MVMLRWSDRETDAEIFPEIFIVPDLMSRIVVFPEGCVISAWTGSEISI